MPVIIEETTPGAIVWAEHQRLVQAGELARGELGPAPNRLRYPQAWDEYRQAHYELAMKIARRAN